MGGAQSVRATHFQHPNTAAAEPEDEPEEHHISISNKMVERLVEDATLGSTTTGPKSGLPRGDYKDKIFMEKLKCLDDSHSERSGLTVEDINALAARIEVRTANMVDVEPVCADCKERIIDCYANTNSPADTVKCWEAIGQFRRNVLEASLGFHTANMVDVEPICAYCKERINDCYANSGSPADTVKCPEAIGEFTKCVQDVGMKRLRARTEREARERVRRSRHVAHAREHALKDLTPGAGDSPDA